MAGKVVGMALYPERRAISSMRSTGRPTSTRKEGGTTDSVCAPLFSTLNSMAVNSPATAEWASKIFGRYERTEYRLAYAPREVTSKEEIVNRETVPPGDLLALPAANRKNGIQGFHISAEIGAWFSEVQGDWIAENLLPPDPSVPAYLPRPVSHQYLLPWDDQDLARLKLTREAEGPKDPPPRQEIVPEASQLRVVEPMDPE